MTALIERVRKTAMKDLERGVKPERLRQDIERFAAQEKFEFCAGIKKALEAVEQ